MSVTSTVFLCIFIALNQQCDADAATAIHSRVASQSHTISMFPSLFCSLAHSASFADHGFVHT